MMKDENTIREFLSEGANLSKSFAEKILANMQSEEKSNMVFNLTQVEFDFKEKQATISYFIIDDSYPDLVLSFDELGKLLNSRF